MTEAVKGSKNYALFTLYDKYTLERWYNMIMYTNIEKL